MRYAGEASAPGSKVHIPAEDRRISQEFLAQKNGYRGGTEKAGRLNPRIDDYRQLGFLNSTTLA